MGKKRTKRNAIDWDNIKVTFVRADKNNLNPHNPNSKLTPEQRRKKMVAISAQILLESDFFECPEK
ncbi:MAG: hypothetical protein KC733_10740 [Candidatus Omnitrophica bacterium]|nr:hypothetical protein [Candidatus Omnitrophota bacterium]